MDIPTFVILISQKKTLGPKTEGFVKFDSIQIRIQR